MALHFCKQCGTVYDDKVGECPRCATKTVMDAVKENAYTPPPSDMTPQEASRARKRAWTQLVIGIPAFIGFIYLLVYILKIIREGNVL